MTRFARRVAAAAALIAAPVLMFAGPAFASDATPAKTTPSATVTIENEVVRLTNIQRTQNGCTPLHIDQRLVAAARTHSTDMVQSGQFSHTGSDGSNFVTREVRAGYPKRDASAENIAWGFRTAQDVMTGWMNSPGHRANILNCESTAVGVGIAYGQGGNVYWTQDFGRN